MSHPSSPRERNAAYLTQAARLAFAALLFTSPWMIQWFEAERRIEGLYNGYTDFFVYPSDLFLGVTVALGLLAPLLARRALWRGPSYLTIPLAALVALGFLSALGSVDPPLTLYHSLRLLVLLGLYLVLVNIPLAPAWVAVPLALAVVIQSSVAILQFAHQSSLGLQLWGELALNPADTGVSILRYDEVRVLRAYGLTDHPNLLGGFLAFALIFIFGYYLNSASGSRQAHRRVRFLFLIPLLLGIVALFYTFSRSAQLAFGVGATLQVGAWLRPKAMRRGHLRQVAVPAALCALALVAPVLNNQQIIAQRVGQRDAFLENVGEVRSLVERDELIGSARRVLDQRQLLGVGNGALTLGMFFLDSEFPRGVYYYQPAHLVVLDVAAELGIPGGFLWLWLMCAPPLVVWMQRARLFASPWNAAIAAAVLAMLVAGLFDYYPWFWQSGRIWQWSAWGLFAAIFYSMSPGAVRNL